MLMKNLNASDLFVKALENEGVEYIYGIPGEENLPLLEAIRKSNIKIILTRHEQAAGFMAAAFGRLTGKVGVALSTLGPGATNFTTAVAYATLGGFPVLFITGQKPIKKSKQGRFQIIDVVSMMKPLTKYSSIVNSVDMVASTVRQAFKIAKQGKSGAVHIEFPEDISEEPVLNNTHEIFPISYESSSLANTEDLQKLADMVHKAKLPIILFGSRCNNKEIASFANDFINQTNLPFVTTQMGKGVISEEHPNFIGTTALSATDYVHDLIEKSDLIINIGYDVIEKPPYLPSKNNKIIHLSDVHAVIDNIYAPVLEIIGDISIAISNLADLIGKCNNDFSYAYKVKSASVDSITKNSDSSGFPMKPQRIVSDICNYMAEEGILSLDNGMYKLWFARNYKALKPNSLLLDNALATMGAGLSVGMECARLYPDKKILAVCGDGGFMMNSQELETAVRLNLNLVILLLNDSAYGMIRWKQSGMNLPDYAMTFNNPDFVKYAESYNAKGHRVQKVADLIPILDKCFKEKGVHLVDLPIDYSENTKVFSQELAKRSKVL